MRGEPGVTAAAGTSLDAAVANTCPYWRRASNKCLSAAVKDHTAATNVLSSIPLSLHPVLLPSIHISIVYLAVCMGGFFH